MKNENISYDGKSFIFNGKRVFINSGEIHYFRIPESQWKDRLLKCKRAFLNTIGTYIAWNWHEGKEGEFSFEKDRDINRWLSLAEEVGLYIFVRPGPYICSEWDFGGLPNYLIPKDCELRSLEQNYIGYCKKYLNTVNKIIKPHLITNGGKIFLYQIENEFEVGDIPYHRKLKEIVEKDGINIPICTNENFWIRGTDIIEGPDPYHFSWVISEVMNKIRNLLKTQPDKPPLGIEVGTHFYSRFYGQMPFSDGYKPPELDEVYLKCLIAAGISGFNRYMFHGGTNIGYWTGRDISTSYDYEAPIREWGELDKRYYIVRRIGGFLECFQEALLETIPVEGECSVNEKGVEIFMRKNNESVFMFLSNTYGKNKEFKINFKDPETGKNIIFPAKNKYQLPGYSATIIPVNLKLSDDLTLLYTTSEIFYFIDNGKEKILILYREDGIDGEISLKIGENIKNVNYTHKNNPQFIVVERDIKLIIIDKEISSKTWFFNYKNKKYPIFSNIYFLEEEKERENNIHLVFQVKEGKNWMKIPFKPLEVKLDNENIEYSYYEENNITEINLPEDKFPEIHYELSGKWKVKEENIENNSDKWLKWRPLECLENYGFLKNGYSIYKSNFNLSKVKKPLYLTLTGFQDEASIYINGKYVNSGRDNLRCEVSSYLSKGDNSLIVLVESEGHVCSGEKSFNGIHSPVYLSSEEKSIELKWWRRKFIPDTYPERAIIREEMEEINDEFDDSSWEKVRVDKKFDSRLFKNSYEECFAWYRTEVEIPDDFEKRGISIDFESGMNAKIYLFVNGKFSGIKENAFLSLPFSFDLTNKVKKGKNYITIGIKVDRWGTHYGLNGTVKITSYDVCLNKNWQVREGIEGQTRGYFSPEFDDSDWDDVEINKEKWASGSLIWFRKKVKIENIPDYISPLRITLKNTSEKALIYFNGVLIGRYSEKGGQEDFYIYEDLIKEENVISVMVDGREKEAKLGEISITPYYISKRISVDIKL